MIWLILLSIYPFGFLVTFIFVAWMLLTDEANRIGPWWQDLVTPLLMAAFWPVTVPFLIYLVMREKEPI